MTTTRPAPASTLENNETGSETDKVSATPHDPDDVDAVAVGPDLVIEAGGTGTHTVVAGTGGQR